MFESETSEDTIILRSRNEKLQTAITELRNTHKTVMSTIEQLTETPVKILMGEVSSGNQDKPQLRKSSETLLKVIHHLKDGLKRLTQAMKEQSEAVDMLSSSAEDVTSQNNVYTTGKMKQKVIV